MTERERSLWTRFLEWLVPNRCHSCGAKGFDPCLRDCEWWND